MFNPDHAHLIPATVGMLWTTANNKKGRTVGQAEMGSPGGMMGKWAGARAEAQVLAWFGGVPDFSSGTSRPAPRYRSLTLSTTRRF